MSKPSPLAPITLSLTLSVWLTWFSFHFLPISQWFLASQLHELAWVYWSDHQDLLANLLFSLSLPTIAVKELYIRFSALWAFGYKEHCCIERCPHISEHHHSTDTPQLSSVGRCHGQIDVGVGQARVRKKRKGKNNNKKSGKDALMWGQKVKEKPSHVWRISLSSPLCSLLATLSPLTSPHAFLLVWKEVMKITFQKILRSILQVPAHSGRRVDSWSQRVVGPGLTWWAHKVLGRGGEITEVCGPM